MLIRQENERLTRIGPGTPMGDVFRRFWLPAMLSEELPHPDCPPKRLRLLGEHLIAFRDTRGRVGILSEFCPHRRASLFFGRNEDCGLRCAYHGWKFDVAGNCVDIPSELTYSTWKKKVQTKAYPTVEQGGAVWVYMGIPDTQPPPPQFEWSLLPEANRRAMRRLLDCNWLQCTEGALDPVHTAILHRYEIAEDAIFGNTRSAEFMDEHRNVVFDCIELDDGLLVISRREAGTGNHYWRFSRFILPCFTMAPPFGSDGLIPWSGFVPRDDESCYRWTVASQPTRPLSDREREALARGGANHVEVDPETLRAKANRSNDYLIDRAAQSAKKTFSGVRGIALQDQAVQENQGPSPIYDRTQERLVSGDKFIVMTRKVLFEALDAVAHGTAPRGRDAAAQMVRSASVIAPESSTLSKIIASGILRAEIRKPTASV